MEMFLMQWFKNFSTTTKTLTLVFAMIFLLLIVAFTGFSTNKTIIGIMNAMFFNYARPAIAMSDMNARAIQNRRMIMSMAIISDQGQSENYEKRVRDNRKIINDELDQYASTIELPEEKTLFENLKRIGSELAVKQDEALAIGMLPPEEAPDGFISRLVGSGDIASLENEYIRIAGEIVQILSDNCESCV